MYTFFMDYGGKVICLCLILLIVFVWTIIRRKPCTQRVFSLALIGSVSALVVDVIIRSIRVWSAFWRDPVARYYLPPYSNLVFDQIWRWVQPVLVATVLSGIVFISLAVIKRKFRLEQYGIDDIMLLTLSALASGWPGFFLSFVAIFFISLFVSIGLHLKRRPVDGQIRLIITPFILPITVAIIWFLPYLTQVTGLYKIRF